MGAARNFGWFFGIHVHRSCSVATYLVAIFDAAAVLPFLPREVFLRWPALCAYPRPHP